MLFTGSGFFGPIRTPLGTVLEGQSTDELFQFLFGCVGYLRVDAFFVHPFVFLDVVFPAKEHAVLNVENLVEVLALPSNVMDVKWVLAVLP